MTAPDGTGVWLVVGHEEVRAALTDPRLCNDVRHSSAWEDDGGYAVGLNMLQTDPPRHIRLRKLVAKEFTSRRIEALRPRVQRITDELLDAVLPLGRADLVASFALPLPMSVICELMGVPVEDRESFHGWSTQTVHPSSPQAATAAAQAMTGYLAELIEGKRRSPGGDLLSALVRAEELSTEEMLGMAFLLLVAGHETTVNLISTAALTLLRHPGQLAALRADLSLVDDAVEEVLRYDGPAQSTSYRFTSEPVEIGGSVIPAGEPVLPVLASVGRDPRLVPDPDRFDIRRAGADRGGHLGFGHGIHHCLGAPLARLEAAIALRTLFERCPRLALDADPSALNWRPSLLRGVRELPVRF